jgi:hypothetical protein
MDGTGLHHRVEGLVIVHLETMGEAPQDPMSLVPIQGAIRLQLLLEDPFPGDNISAKEARHQVPIVVRLQGLILLHSVLLVGVGERTTDRGRLRGERQRGGRENMSGHHRVDVPRVPVEGNKVIHRRRLASGSQSIGPAMSLVDVNGVREVRQRGRFGRRQLVRERGISLSGTVTKRLG